MILVDTSVWVAFLRGVDDPTVVELRTLIASDASLAICEPIAMELLAGARAPRELRAVESLTNGLHTLPIDAALDFRAAAELYRAAREVGHPIRSMIDGLIAAIAIRHGAALLERDRDYRYLAEVSVLQLHVA